MGFEQKKAVGLFEHNTGIAAKYAQPDINLSDDDFKTSLREIRDAWKEDME
jgi:hypothetical protein